MNPPSVSRLVVFDTWLRNCDRYSWPEDRPGVPRVNRDNVFFSSEATAGQFLLKAFDHTHCFTCGRSWTSRLAYIDKTKDPRIYGLFPEFRQVLNMDEVEQSVARLRELERPAIAQIASTIPDEWEVPEGAAEAMIDFVVGRAAYVAETIADRLQPQRKIVFDNDDREPTR